MENSCDSFAARDIHCKASWVLCHEAFAHYTQNCKTCSYVPYARQLFVTAARIFSIVLYMGDFLRKVCKCVRAFIH